MQCPQFSAIPELHGWSQGRPHYAVNGFLGGMYIPDQWGNNDTKVTLKFPRSNRLNSSLFWFGEAGIRYNADNYSMLMTLAMKFRNDWPEPGNWARLWEGDAGHATGINAPWGWQNLLFPNVKPVPVAASHPALGASFAMGDGSAGSRRLGWWVDLPGAEQIRFAVSGWK